MTTLLHLNQTIVDIQDSLNREQRFSRDACHNLLNGTKLLRDAIEALERDIRAHFEERDRSISMMVGTSQPYTTVIEDHNEDQPAIEAKKAGGKKPE